MSNPRILYIQYTNPAAYPPLEHSSRIFAKEGWQVLFLGTFARTANEIEFPSHENIRVLRMRYCPPGIRQKLQYTLFSVWCFFRMFLFRPQWLYVSDPLACPTAMLLCLFPSVRLLYHEHDSPGDSQMSAFGRITLWCRAHIARQAVLCLLPNESRINHFCVQTGRKDKTVCVWNCPRIEEVSPQRFPHRGKVVWLLYHGSINPHRLPLRILEALRALPDCIKLRIIGYETTGFDGYLERLNREAMLLGIKGRLEIIGSLPRSSLMNWCRQSDIGLSFMPRVSSDVNLQNMIGASNKAFDYLAAGMALLVSDLPDWQEMFVKPGFARACNPEDPVSLTEALRWFLAHPAEMRLMGEDGRKMILSKWNYEKQFEPVQQFVQSTS